MLTLKEVKNFLSVDFDDDDSLIEMLMKVADEYLKSAINKNYNSESERAKMLSLIIIKDLYDNREYESDKTSSNVKKLVNEFCFQLKVESRDDSND